MSETAYQAQRRTLRELKDKQDGQGPVSHVKISAKAQARRDAEAAAKPVAKKKVSKKK